MVPECSHILYTGKQCRRIPAKGQKFCPAHRSRRRREDDTFDREIEIYSDALVKMEFPELLAALEKALVGLRPRLPRSARTEVHRAGLAVNMTLQHIEEATAQMPPAPTVRQHPPQPDRPLSHDEMERFLETLLDPYTSGKVL